MTITIEPLATIISWVLGICLIIFLPMFLIFTTIFLIKLFKELL